MLKGKTFNMSAKSVITDGETEVELCAFVALIKPAEDDVQFLIKPLDKEASRQFRQIVREDRAEFEDAAYALLDELKNA